MVARSKESQPSDHDRMVALAVAQSNYCDMLGEIEEAYQHLYETQRQFFPEFHVKMNHHIINQTQKEYMMFVRGMMAGLVAFYDDSIKTCHELWGEETYHGVICELDPTMPTFEEGKQMEADHKARVLDGTDALCPYKVEYTELNEADEVEFDDARIYEATNEMHAIEQLLDEFRQATGIKVTAIKSVEIAPGIPRSHEE